MENKISDLFHCKNGYASSNIEKIEDNKISKLHIPYQRPAKSILTNIAGYIDKRVIPENHIYSNCIAVSTDGEGSHTYSYYIKYEFVPNSNVMVLIPKVSMSEIEMLFYSKIITFNRYRFQYGRKPKGERLTEMLIPDLKFVREQIQKTNYTNIDIEQYKRKKTKENIILKDVNDWHDFDLIDYFDMFAGKYYPKTSYNEGSTPLISASAKNNGVMGFTNLNPVFKGNALTIGKVEMPVFYQEKDFCATSDVTVLIPKIKIKKQALLFIKTMLEMEQYKWSYGRQIRLGDSSALKVKLPSKTENNKKEPDFKFMYDFINATEYSYIL